ncbi:hypothetical protein EOJ36_08640 [Sandaracinomonas limnophila]|uniref:Uncharacterized protein n=1 Tax=Sandaracinomonas limnophila TaxID=1862386 RepID=A0A437PS48_9BACT|nr:hypothetical protein [Sandaracinomonas limnophila]RVU25062.1 hypothetical protein EOJ36_08640 [Sandaracinomonas limnophila]
MQIQRFIPNTSELNNYYDYFFDDHHVKKPYDTADYLKVIQIYETQCEQYFIDLFNKLGIQSSTKTERYSLPFSDEIVHVQEGTHNLYITFNLQEFARIVVLELLNKEVKKLRFYILGDVDMKRNKGSVSLYSKIVWRFRFYKSI